MEKELFKQLPQMDRIEYQLKANQIDGTYYPFLVLILGWIAASICASVGAIETAAQCMLIGFFGMLVLSFLEYILCSLQTWKLDREYIKMFELKKSIKSWRREVKK